MKLRDRIDEINEQIAKLEKEKGEAIKAIQDACSHPVSVVETMSYSDSDGTWRDTHKECQACGKRLELDKHSSKF